MTDIANLLGLALNFFGALLIAVSFGKNPGDAHQENEQGRKIYLASYRHPNLFRGGLILLVVGFFVQIIPIICRLFFSE